MLPGIPFHFHAADLVENVGAGQAGIQQFREYLESAQSLWISVHISIWQPGELRRLKSGQTVPLPDPDKAAQGYLGKVMQLVKFMQCPVLIENVEPLPMEGYDFWAHPGFIRHILDETGCGFLLDTGHARISAESLKMTDIDYLQLLPLDRVLQVHSSGPRYVEGRLADLHQPLQEVDYELLAFILNRVRPQVVTLEYIQDVELLRGQLERLRSIIG